MSTLPLLMQIALHLVVSIPVVLLTGCSTLLLAIHHEQQRIAIADAARNAIVSEDSMQVRRARRGKRRRDSSFGGGWE